MKICCHRVQVRRTVRQFVLAADEAESERNRGKRLKLAIDCRLILEKPTGIGSYVAGLARAILSLPNGPDLVLVTGRRFPSELSAIRRDPRVRFAECPLPSFGPRQRLLARHYLNDLEADVLLYPHHDVPFLLKIPVVTVIHHVPSLRIGTGPNVVKRLLLLASLAWAVHRSERVVAVSQFTAELLRKRFGVAEWRVKPIYPPPSPVTFAEPGAALPEGLTAGKYFLAVAEWRPHKNLPRLIRAFGQVKKSLGASWKLAVAGAAYGRYREPEEEIQRKGLEKDVLLLGKVAPSELRALYENAAALVFVSLLENFGYPVVEAFHFGTPVICSNVGSLPEVANDAAVFVDPKSETEIGEAMLSVARDHELRARLAEAGRAELERFEPRFLAEQTVEVCREAAEAR